MQLPCRVDGTRVTMHVDDFSTPVVDSTGECIRAIHCDSISTYCVYSEAVLAALMELSRASV